MEKINNFVKLRLMAGFEEPKYAIKAIGCSKSMFYMMEEGERSPSPKLAAKMCKAYGCTFNDIYGPGKKIKQSEGEKVNGN